MAISDARGTDTYLNSMLPLLADKLREALRRSVLDQLLFVVAIAISSAAIVFGALAIAEALSAEAQSQTTALWIALGTGAAAGLVAAAVIVRPPKLIELARTADIRFELRERASTALELVDRREVQASPFGRALVGEVGDRAETIDPRRLVPFRWARAAYPLIAALAFATVALALPTAETVQNAAPVEVAAELTETETETLAEDLRRVADLLREDAATRDDPFLGAIARDVEQLGAQLEGAEIPNREALIEELERIAEFTTEAYAGPGVAALSERNLAPLLDTIIQELEQGPREFTAQQAAPEGDGTRAETPANPDAAPNTNTPALDEMFADAEADRLGDVQRQEPGVGAEGTATEVGGYVEAAQEALAEAGAREPGAPQDVAGGQLAGPAANADQGGGFLAGEGVQPLGDTITEVDPFEALGELLLEDELDGDGRRIRIEVPQQAADANVPDQIVVAGDWRRLPEKEINRQALTADQRETVARYFRAEGED